jgi:type I restriction enzyme, S subunit
MDLIKANANGSTFQEISKRNFRPIPVVFPGSAALKRFTEAVGPLLDLVRLHEKQSQTLAAMRDLLIPKLMSGEIRLRDAKRAVAEAAA